MLVDKVQKISINVNNIYKRNLLETPTEWTSQVFNRLNNKRTFIK